MGWLTRSTPHSTSLGTPVLPVNIRLEDIVFQALLTKPFPGLGGALEMGGL